MGRAAPPLPALQMEGATGHGRQVAPGRLGKSQCSPAEAWTLGFLAYRMVTCKRMKLSL